MSSLDWRFSQRFFKGRAKVRLSNLNLTNTNTRTTREEDIQALVEKFQSEGCIRLNPDNYIKVLVPNDFPYTLKDNIAGDDEILDLPAHVQINVLQGKHRVLAAERAIWDKWWIADFYTENLPQSFQTIIREEHPNAQPFCDGDIYRNVRTYEQLGNVDAELKWRGRFSKTAQREMHRLEKDFKHIRRALDNLLEFKGLWNFLKISYLGRWLSIRCQEEIIQYLTLIYKKWEIIMSGYSGSLLDPQTVSLLETRMPFTSSHDEEKIRDMMRRHELFPNLPTEESREAILEKILQINGRILSLHTFTRDFFYFEACAIALRKLLPPTKRSMAEEFRWSYSGINQTPGVCTFQIGDSRFATRTGSSNLCPRIGYQQLFLAVMRDFPSLTKLSPYKNRKDHAADGCGFPSERLYKLAEIATRLGFSNSAISRIRSMDVGAPYEAATSEFLVQLQPTDRYLVNPQERTEVAQFVGNALDRISVTRASNKRAVFTTNLHEPPKKSRCSRPSIRDYQEDREYLFLEILMDDSSVRRAYPTSLGIQKDIFVSFFGDLHGSQELSTDSSFRGDSSPANSISYSRNNDSFAEGSSSYSRDNDSFTGDSSSLHQSHSPYEGISPRYSPSPHRIPSLQESPLPQEESSLSEDDLLPEEENPLLPEDSYEHSGSSFLDPDFNFSDDRQIPFKAINNGIRPSSVIHELLNDEQYIIFYLSGQNKFVKFPVDEPELPNFRATANWLIDNDNMFLCCVSGRWRVVPMRHLYATARETKLILVLRKLSRARPGSLLSLRNGLYRFLDREYDHPTHNRGR